MLLEWGIVFYSNYSNKQTYAEYHSFLTAC